MFDPLPFADFPSQLLAKEIHKEFSAIFQCFRHLVRNDFFDATPAVAADSSAPAAATEQAHV